MKKEKINMLKNLKRRLILTGMISQTVALTACGSNSRISNKDNNINNNEKVYSVGEHMLLGVDRVSSLVGKSGRYGLTAPDGYVVIDYDYDKTDYFEFNDYVYKNKQEVIVDDFNDFGVPSSNYVIDDDGIYEPGSHVIVDIERKINLSFGKNDEKITLTAPEGYDVLDYDYDKTDTFEFENITYVNKDSVYVDNVNDFGTVVGNDVVNNKTSNYFEIGEHKIVEINRNCNPLLGKNEMKQLIAPDGYRIIDYDYDKTDYFEFETITYENIVPVIVDKENDFGIPDNFNLELINENGEYDVGQHVLVKIDRSFDCWIGYNDTRELTSPDGYDLLDYDYDKNDRFEFETYVYVNNEKVSVTDSNDFGTVINNNTSKKLKR